MDPQELLEQALLEAREAPARSRSLEGQLLQALSEVLFGKVGRFPKVRGTLKGYHTGSFKGIYKGSMKGLGLGVFRKLGVP